MHHWDVRKQQPTIAGKPYFQIIFQALLVRFFKPYYGRNVLPICQVDPPYACPCTHMHTHAYSCMSMRTHAYPTIHMGRESSHGTTYISIQTQELFLQACLFM